MLLYMVTFTINIPQMLAYMPYMDPMGYSKMCLTSNLLCFLKGGLTPNDETDGGHGFPEDRFETSPLGQS